MKMHKLEFSGEILERGFWLYVWRVTCGRKIFFYVGRTGDNSSINAASTFGRLSQHLDIRPGASANMLLRHIRKADLNPVKCNYDLFAYGPIFSEKKTKKQHVKYRDIMAPLELALADHLRSKGLIVWGKHYSKFEPDKILLVRIKRHFDEAISLKYCHKAN